MKPSRCSL